MFATDHGTNPSGFHVEYEALKRLAHKQLRNDGGHTLNTTALVHELYLRLSRSNVDDLALGTAQLYTYAAKAMRHILVDKARYRLRAKDNGSLERVSLSDPHVGDVALSPLAALQLDAALDALEVDHPRAAKVVELHYFGGLELADVASALGVVRRTIDRDWRYARAYLAAQLD